MENNNTNNVSQISMPGITPHPIYVTTQNINPQVGLNPMPTSITPYPYQIAMMPNGYSSPSYMETTVYPPNVVGSVVPSSPIPQVEITQTQQTSHQQIAQPSFPSEHEFNITFKDKMLAREYIVNFRGWFTESIELFSRFWIYFLGWVLLYFAAIMIGIFFPFLSWITLPIMCGGVYVTFNLLRTTSAQQPEIREYFQGFFWIIPIICISVLMAIAIGLGFLLIIPGIYFMVTLSFSLHLYMEYGSEGIGIYDSLFISYSVCKKQFWNILGLLIVDCLICISGILLIGIGIFITIPISLIYGCVAFRDIFGLRDHHQFAMQNMVA